MKTLSERTTSQNIKINILLRKKFFYFFAHSKKTSIFALAIQRCIVDCIGIWCNGNTTDSGPVIPGSNPGIPTLPKKQSVGFRQIVFCFHSLIFLFKRNAQRLQLVSIGYTVENETAHKLYGCLRCARKIVSIFMVL